MALKRVSRKKLEKIAWSRQYRYHLIERGFTMLERGDEPPTRQEAHTPRWSAPEILHEQNPSKESDIYSFAMVTIEVYRERSAYVIFC